MALNEEMMHITSAMIRNGRLTGIDEKKFGLSVVIIHSPIGIHPALDIG
jgi:hypothetical protein